jgi:hypothetical protein
VALSDNVVPLAMPQKRCVLAEWPHWLYSHTLVIQVPIIHSILDIVTWTGLLVLRMPTVALLLLFRL